MNLKNVFQITTFWVLLAGCNNTNTATNTTLKPFQLKMEKTTEGMKISCLEGCAWSELTFSKNEYQSQIIDEYGMVDAKKKNPVKESDQLADFSISVIKTQEGIELKGEKGTAWTKLTFSKNEYQPQLINQNGMMK